MSESKITIVGWKRGFNKIGLTKVLNEKLNYSLSEAKELTDKLLDNQNVTIILPSEVDSKVVGTELVELGILISDSE